MSQNNSLTRRILIKALGVTVCVCPVCVVILSYFPLWINKADACVLSGLALCLLLIAMIPFYKQITRILKSPSSYVLWFIIFVIFFFLSKIADEMTIISFVGFLSNLVGAIIFKLGAIWEAREKANE